MAETLLPESLSGSGAARTGERRRRTQIALIMVNQGFQSLALGGLALFLPLIRSELHITFAQAGALSAASTLSYALMQIPSGFVADHIGPRKLFVIGLAATNVLTLVLATLHSYPLMIANQVLMGVARSLVFAPGLLLMAALFAPKRRATAMGLYVASGFSSSVLLNTFGPFLVGPLGWRGLFVVFSLGGLVTLLAYRLLTPPDVPVAATERPSLGALFALFRSRFMLLIGGVQFVRHAVMLSMTVWLPTFLVSERHHSLRLAGLAVAIGSAFTAPSNFLGGYVSDRLQRPALVIGASLGVLAVTTSLLVEVKNVVLVVAVIALQAFFVQLYFGPLFAMPIGLLGMSRAGIASGFGNFFANLGGMTFTYALGSLKDSTGSFALGFHLLSAMCVFGVILTILAARAAHAIQPSMSSTS